MRVGVERYCGELPRRDGLTECPVASISQAGTSDSYARNGVQGKGAVLANLCGPVSARTHRPYVQIAAKRGRPSCRPPIALSQSRKRANRPLSRCPEQLVFRAFLLRRPRQQIGTSTRAMKSPTPSGRGFRLAAAEDTFCLAPRRRGDHGPGSSVSSGSESKPKPRAHEWLSRSPSRPTHPSLFIDRLGHSWALSRSLSLAGHLSYSKAEQ
jgi:hypothetical protein